MTSKMVVQQPQPIMYTQESDEWSSGICDCCQDVPGCCCAFWCLPCFACITSRDYGEPLCLPLLEIFSGWIPAVTMSMRVNMRQRYRIRGTICRDCVISTFCCACTWCQMSREMKRRNVSVVMVGAKNT